MVNQKCHLMDDSVASYDLTPTSEKFIVFKTLVDESHLFRYLMKCRVCGQMYFFEFYEEIDWKEGKDPQYCTYIPINSVEEGKILNQKSQLELLGIKPRLQSDFVGDKKNIRWVK